MMIMPIAEFPDNLTLKQREDIEEDWILKCNTLFPYGLNVRCKKAKILDSETDVLNSKSTIYSKFVAVKIRRGYRGGTAINDNQSTQFDPDKYFNDVFEDNLSGFRDIRTKLSALKKNQLKAVYIKSVNLYRYSTADNNLRNYHLTLFIKDLSWFYLVRMNNARNIKPKSNNFIIFNCQ